MDRFHQNRSDNLLAPNFGHSTAHFHTRSSRQCQRIRLSTLIAYGEIARLSHLATFEMALIPDIQSRVARNISLAELGVRGSLRVTQTFARVAPKALRWGLLRQRPPPGE